MEKEIKYIIKNCPGIFFKELDKKPMCNDLKQGSYPCYECDNCTIKEIVKECRIKIEVCEGCSKGKQVETYDECNGCNSGSQAALSRHILNFLEIEEIEKC